MNTIDPKMFTFALTYNIVLIVVLGGNDSITGSIIAAIAVTVSMEALRFLDSSLNFVFFQTPALPGLRMVVFSLLLLFVIIYRPRGLMGRREFSWKMVFNSPPARLIEERLKASGAKKKGDAPDA